MLSEYIPYVMFFAVGALIVWQFVVSDKKDKDESLSSKRIKHTKSIKESEEIKK